MRTLTINIADIGAKASDDDVVTIWSPVIRSSPTVTGRLVSTRPQHVKLIKGQGSIEVEPGPIMVQFRCHGFADTAPRKAVVPEGGGSVSLQTIFAAAENYEPPIMSQLQQLVQRAEAASSKITDVSNQVTAARESATAASSAATRAATYAGNAETHADTAETHKNAAAQSAIAASSDRQAAQSAASSADTTAQTVAQNATRAETARDIAETASTKAEGFKNQAETFKTAAEAAADRAEQAGGSGQGGNGLTTAEVQALINKAVQDVPTLEEVERDILPKALAQGVKIVQASATFTEALQAAIDDPAVGVIEIPRGEFQLTDVINLDKLTGKVLRGQGPGTIIKAAKNSGKNAFQSTSGGSLNRAVIRDFVVDMDWSTADKTASAFQITNANHVTFSHVHVLNSGAHGFLLQGFGGDGKGTADCLIAQCEVHGAGLKQNTQAQGASGFGILVKDNSPRNKIVGNKLTGISCGMGIGGNATTLGAPTNTLVHGNDVTMVTSPIGFEPVGFTKDCTHTIVANNQLPVSFDNGVSIGSDSIVQGNTIGQTQNHGIACSGVNTKIFGNEVANIGLANATGSPADWGVIALENPKHCQVWGNSYRQDAAGASAAHMVKINITSGTPASAVGGNVLVGNVADKALIAKSWFHNLDFNPAEPDVILERAAKVEDNRPAWKIWLDPAKRYCAPVSYWWADHRQPKSNWHWWLRNADAIPFAIVNPRSGPGDKKEPDFENLIPRIKALGKPVLGYVRTTAKFEPPRETRTKAEIMGDIAKHVEFYNVDGVFLDEMINAWSDDQVALIPFYQDLYKSIKALYGNKFLIVGNPGTNTKEEILSCADILMTFEHKAQTYLDDTLEHLHPYHYQSYPAARFVHVIHDVINDRQARACMDRAQQLNIASLYLTDDIFSGVQGSESEDNNPWDDEPSPWLQDLNLKWARRQPWNAPEIPVFNPRQRFVAFPSDMWPDVANHDGAYARLIQHAPSLSLISYNRQTDRPEPDFVKAMELARHAGVQSVIAQVDTNNAERSIQDVMTDIAKQVKNYGATGVFLSKINITLEKQGYYLEIHEKCKATYGANFVTVLNCNAWPPREFAYAADVLLTENIDSTKFVLNDYADIPSWAWWFPPTKFFHVVYNVWNQAQLDKVLHKLNTRNVAHVWVTDDLDKPEWPDDTPRNTVPPSWLLESLAAWVQRRPTPIPAAPAIADGADATVNQVLAALRTHGIIQT